MASGKIAESVASRRVSVSITSDTVCPWCYVGKRRLETALKQLKGEKDAPAVEVQWHPYQLNPNASKEGINKLQYYKQKFGEQRTASMVPQMKETYAKEDLNYTMDGLTGNTFNSHRLIAAAGRQGPDVQDRVVEELFKAYFTEGKYINDPEVLRAAARAAGVQDGDQIVADESICAEQVREELREHGRGVTGVPHFVFNGKYAVSGAQDPAVFLDILRRL